MLVKMTKNKGGNTMDALNEYTVSVQISHLLATDIGLLGDEATIIDTINNTDESITLENLPQAILKLFRVRMSEDNIRYAVNSLITQNKLYKEGQILLISPRILEEISKMSVENERIEEAALSEWISKYQEQENVILESEDVKKFRECILSFVRTLFLRHGADCYNLIAGEKDIEYLDLNIIAQSVVGPCKELECEKMITFLCSIFSGNISAPQTAFFMTQLKKAIHYLSMVVNQNVESTIIKQMNGISLYLDTPILYRLFNLQGEKRCSSIKQLISFCQNANIQLKVFEATVNELKRRISYDAKIIVDYPIPTSFAKIGYNCRTSENYISTFWRETEATGVSAKDFNFRFSDVVALLESHEIEIDRNDYISEFALSECICNLCSKVVKYSSSDPRYKKSPHAIDHDATCLAMVSSLQDSSANTAIESKTIFLSTDWSLIRLQRADKEYKEKTDMVVSPSQLMQIFCMTAPETDFYDAFLGLFSSSRASFGTSHLENEQIQQIMGRIAMYRGTTPAFAERVLSNQLIQSQFSAKVTDEDRLELIDNTMILTVEAMEREMTEKDGTVQRFDASLREETDKNLKNQTLIDELSKRIEHLEIIYKDTSTDLKDTTQELSKYKDNFEIQAHQKARNKALARILSGGILLLLGVFAVGVGLFALIPPLSQFVKSIYCWVGSSAILAGASNDAIVAILIALGVSTVSAGVFLIKPGYKSLEKRYFDDYIQKMN